MRRQHGAASGIAARWGRLALAWALVCAGAAAWGCREHSGAHDAQNSTRETQSAAAPARESPGGVTPAGRQGGVRFGAAEPAEKPPGTFRLASYNVENLFDAIDDPALSGRWEDMNSVKPESQLAGVADTIRRLDADVLALQEVESAQVLLWFRDTYLSGAGYEHHASIDAGDERGIEQGVLSRFPIVEATNWAGEVLGGTHPALFGDAENWYAGQTIKFHRSPLRVRVAVPGADGAWTLTLFVVHHKSGRGGDYWRQAEAERTAELVAAELAADPRAPVAVLGDFNATPDETVDDHYLRAGLEDLFGARIPGDPRFVTHASGRTIDYILGSAGLAWRVAGGSRFILGTPVRAEGEDYRSTPAPEGYASDHFPVVVDVRRD